VFNPLDFSRTDVVDLPVGAAGPYQVTDLAAGAEVASQVDANLDGTMSLRFLARDVPPLGYRVYRYEIGAGATFSPAATIAGNSIQNSRYSVTLGSRGGAHSPGARGTGRGP